MAALLHDAMEDCGVTKAELIERFGAPTAELVDGLTKLDKLQFITREEARPSRSARCCWRWRATCASSWSSWPTGCTTCARWTRCAARQARRASPRETLEIYAPIAHRLGLNQTYRELQELSFAHLQPVAPRRRWRRRCSKARGYRRDIVERVQQRRREGVRRRPSCKVQIFGREKTLYSIYRKMREKHLSFAQVNDIFGFRIVVADAARVLHRRSACCTSCTSRCRAASRTTSRSPRPTATSRCTPRWSSPLGTAVEFQIRTEPMHAVAETGIAAHWLYKSQGRRPAERGAAPGRACGCSRCSTSRTRRATRPSSSSTSRSTCSPTRSTSSRRRAKILALPRGATPVDFAYAIHSDVGDHMRGRQGQRRAGAAAHRAEERRRGRGHHRAGRAAEPGLAQLRAHRPRALEDPPLPEDTWSRRSRSELGEKLLAQALRAEGLAAAAGRRRRAPAPIWQQLLRWSGNRTPRRPADRHRPRPQDRHHRRQAAGARCWPNAARAPTR